MKQFLIIQLARFGDVVQTKRLVQSLEQRGQVHLCLDSSLCALAAIVYPHAVLHGVPAHILPGKESFEQVRSLHKTLNELQNIDFCAVYNLNFSPLNTALVRIFPYEKVQGYAVKDGQLIRSAWIHKAFRWTQNRQTSPINLVDYWAYFDADPICPSKVNPSAAGEGKGMGVVLAGRESRRSLPMPVLAQVVRTYFEATAATKSHVSSNFKIYLLGSVAEMALARKLRKLLPSHLQNMLVDLSGKTSWKELADALVGLDVVLSPDTGTMHLAAHLGVPVTAFFLSSAWCHETGPYGQGHFVWQSAAMCAPCLETATCLIDTKCLEDFSKRDFYRLLTTHIQGKGRLNLENTNDFTLTGQKSYVDALGSTWEMVYGEDKHEQGRKKLRAVLTEYCGQAQSLPYDTNTIELFYDEADWMLRAQQPCFATLTKEG